MVERVRLVWIRVCSAGGRVKKLDTSTERDRSFTLGRVGLRVRQGEYSRVHGAGVVICSGGGRTKTCGCEDEAFAVVGKSYSKVRTLEGSELCDRFTKYISCSCK